MEHIRDASIDKTMQEDEITYEEATKHVYDACIYEGIDERIQNIPLIVKWSSAR